MHMTRKKGKKSFLTFDIYFWVFSMTHVPSANMMEEGIYDPLQAATTGVDGNVWASLLGNNCVIYLLQIVMC